MKKIENFRKFQERFKKLADVKSAKGTYLIKITFDNGSVLFEHEIRTQFQNSTKWYLNHPESTNPPVRGHYHVYPSKKGKNEIYAVNLDGTAHHKSNRGHEVPRKEAEELIALGVAIKNNRIIEFVEFLEEEKQLLNESLQQANEIYYLEFEE